MLDGTLSPERAKRHPAPTLTEPTKPDWLSPEAGREWDRVVPELSRLRLLSSVDHSSLAVYCEAWSSFVQAAVDVRERGVLIPGARSGDLVRNPSAQVMRDSATTMRAYATEFGLTPQARARMTLPTDDDAKHEAEELFSRL